MCPALWFKLCTAVSVPLVSLDEPRSALAEDDELLKSPEVILCASSAKNRQAGLDLKAAAAADPPIHEELLVTKVTVLFLETGNKKKNQLSFFQTNSNYMYVL